MLSKRIKNGSRLVKNSTKGSGDDEERLAVIGPVLDCNGAPGVSRTRGPQIRNLSLYPSELQGQPRLVFPKDLAI